MYNLVTKVLVMSRLSVKDGVLHNDFEDRIIRLQSLLSTAPIDQAAVDGAVALGMHDYDPVLAASNIRFPHKDTFGHN